MTDISEAASKKRGRPKAVPAWWLRNLYPEIKTERGQQNRYYAQQAIGAFNLLGVINPECGTLPEGYEHLQWLADWKGGEQGKAGAVKYSILAELGRMLETADYDTVLSVADVIFREKPATKDAVVRIRRVRTGGKAPAPDREALFDRLAKCVDEYRLQHPGMTIPEVLKTIDELWRVVQTLEEE